MKKILIDSGPLIAVFDSSYRYHQESINFIKSNKYPLITTILIYFDAKRYGVMKYSEPL